MRARGFVIALAIPLVLGAAAFAGFDPTVRRKVAKEAGRRHVSVHYGSARPRWSAGPAIELVGVEIAPQGVDGVRATLPSVVISLTNGFAVRSLDVHGGALDFRGDVGDIAEHLRKWRALSETTPADEGATHAHTPIHADGVSVHASSADGTPYFDFRGVTFDRYAEISFGAESGTATAGAGTIAVRGGRIEVSSDGTLQRAHAERLDLAWKPAEVPHELDPAVRPTDDDDLPPVPALAPIVTRGGKPNAKPVAPLVAPSAGAQAGAPAPLLAMPDLPALRTKLARIAALLGERLPDKGTVDVDGFSATYLGTHPLSIGPAPLRVTHDAGAIEINFRSAEADLDAATGANGASATNSAGKAGKSAGGSTPLTLHASLPLAGGDITASLSGGPIGLADLGVKEGAAGLRDTDRATVAGEGRLILDASGESLSFDGGADLRDLSLQDARLASGVLHHLDIGVRARGTLSRAGVVNLAEANVHFGALKLRVHGELAADTAHTAAQLDFDVPVTSCEAMLTSIPTALLPTVSMAHISGTFGATGAASFDTRSLDNLKLAYHVDDGCRMDTVPRDLLPDRFAHPFVHRVYGPDGEQRDEQTGPGTAHWADLERISPFLQVAVLTTEDGQFPHHHGFNHNAMKNALIANLKARRFVRGASTITMQLAKNLFLTREKTLSRKLEEIILTDYLEQVFQKDEMMELYLNIIEFGPDVYGAEEAAQHYFGRPPDELNLVECMFLSSIMPSPIRFHKMYERGAVSEAWLNHLRQLMRVSLRAGTITPAELEEGLKEPLEFHREGDPPPPERAPAVGAHFKQSNGDDGAWDTVE